MDSVPRVDHDDQEWFASRHRGHLNQKARLHWEDEAKGRVLYLSWRNLSWIWDDLVSTIHIVRKVLFIPFLPLLFPTLQQPCLQQLLDTGAATLVGEDAPSQLSEE